MSLPSRASGKENQDFLTKPIRLVRKIKISLPDRASGKEYQDLLTKPTALVRKINISGFLDFQSPYRERERFPPEIYLSLSVSGRDVPEGQTGIGKPHA